VVAVNFDGDNIIVTSFQRDENVVYEMLNWICVGFEMEPKIGANVPWDSGTKIGLRRYNTLSTPALEKDAERLQAMTGGHGKDPVTVQVPQMAIPHIYEGRETSWVHDDLGIGSVHERWKRGCYLVQIRHAGIVTAHENPSKAANTGQCSTSRLRNFLNIASQRSSEDTRRIFVGNGANIGHGLRGD
jgi:hypothetical protein